MRVFTVDPGAKPGFCMSEGGAVTWAGHEDPGACLLPVAELIVEAQFAAATVYRDGKKVRISRKSQMTLAHTAGRFLERYAAARRYQILPDAWRAILWPGARRLAKRVVLARLEKDYGHLVPYTVPAKNRPDVLEAVGMNVAWCRLSPAQKEQYRAK